VSKVDPPPFVFVTADTGFSIVGIIYDYISNASEENVDECASSCCPAREELSSDQKPGAPKIPHPEHSVMRL
jgi:hypothetical protein